MSWQDRSNSSSRINSANNSFNDSTISYRSSTIHKLSNSSINQQQLPPLSSTNLNTNRFNSTTTTTTSKLNNTRSTAKNGGSEDLIQKIENLVVRNRSLEEENNVLRSLISEENGKFNNDERRILMLKCQVFQLEKQVNMLSRVLSFRKHAHTEALNTLTFLCDSFRSMSITNEYSANSTVHLNKQEIHKWTELCESTRIKLYKAEDNDADDVNISEPILFKTNYSKADREISVLDVCSGNLNHINIKQVAGLESNLSELYKKLIRLKESLKTATYNKNTQKDGKQQTSFEYIPAQKENISNILDGTIKTCAESCKNLFSFSLLVPSAPWSLAKRSIVFDLTEEMLLNKLKTFNLPKVKHQLVELLLKSYYIATNYHFHMKKIESMAINEELKFYRTTYSLQKSYIETLVNSFQGRYAQFISDLNNCLKQPLQELINKFWKMKTESNEENLKDFLNYFKLNSNKLETILSNLNNELPDKDMIYLTFNQVLTQLDSEIKQANEKLKTKINNLQTDLVGLGELSTQSDQLLIDVIKISSPSLSLSNSRNDLTKDP